MENESLDALIAIAEVARYYSNCALNEHKGLEMSSERKRFEMCDQIYYLAYQMGFAEGRNYAYNTIYNICLEQTKITDKEMRLKIAERRLKLVKELEEDK